MPGVTAIVRHWAEQGTFRRVESDEDKNCFACGDPARSLERCHLVAEAQGGGAEVSNIVLLCKRCHLEAPMIGSSAQPMIDWISRREDYRIRLYRRLVEECGAIRPTLLEEASGLGLDEEEWGRLLAVAGQGMKLGYHPEGDMLASGAALVCCVVDALK